MCSSTDLNSFSPRNLTFFLSHNDMSHHLNSLVSKCTVHHLIFQFSPITAVMYILTPNQVAKFLKDKVQFFQFTDHCIPERDNHGKGDKKTHLPHFILPNNASTYINDTDIIMQSSQCQHDHEKAISGQLSFLRISATRVRSCSRYLHVNFKQHPAKQKTVKGPPVSKAKIPSKCPLQNDHAFLQHDYLNA